MSSGSQPQSVGISGHLGDGPAVVDPEGIYRHIPVGITTRDENIVGLISHRIQIAGDVDDIWMVSRSAVELHAVQLRDGGTVRGDTKSLDPPIIAVPAICHCVNIADDVDPIGRDPLVRIVLERHIDLGVV